MSTLPAIPDPKSAPAVPDRVRSIAYIVGLAVAAITLGIITTTGTLAAAEVIPGTTALVVSTVAGGVASVVGTIASGLGVVYRPTRT